MSLTLPTVHKGGTRCWYALLDLEDGDRAQLDAWLADTKIDGARIARALHEYGVTASQVNNHRRDHLNKPCR